jgi:nucleoside-diphosphate-sugar epimerase
MRRLIPFIQHAGIQKVLFISSTSVYPENNQHAKEDDHSVPEKASGRALLEAENILKQQTDFKTTIIRFGGLIGLNRNPARFLLKSSQPIEDAPVNLIHQDDCIEIISAIISQNVWGETFNACSPEHPMKKDFYTKAAIQSGYTVPEMSSRQAKYKIVDSSKLIRLLNYQFIYPNPIEYLETAFKP